ncbi:lupeol synthase [Artemisia annua]|uniref:Lupeol synthase n=1 Tax=Artemisia annua TaxID=35608 RepID=A0A2U1P260_ARTAN|nr:lupeol synthase [Artemisia annua]
MVADGIIEAHIFIATAFCFFNNTVHRELIASVVRLLRELEMTSFMKQNPVLGCKLCSSSWLWEVALELALDPKPFDSWGLCTDFSQFQNPTYIYLGQGTKCKLRKETQVTKIPEGIKLEETEEVTKKAVTTTLRRAISFYSTIQAHDGTKSEAKGESVCKRPRQDLGDSIEAFAQNLNHPTDSSIAIGDYYGNLLTTRQPNQPVGLWLG